MSTVKCSFERYRGIIQSMCTVSAASSMLPLISSSDIAFITRSSTSSASTWQTYAIVLKLTLLSSLPSWKTNSRNAMILTFCERYVISLMISGNRAIIWLCFYIAFWNSLIWPLPRVCKRSCNHSKSELMRHFRICLSSYMIRLQTY